LTKLAAYEQGTNMAFAGIADANKCKDVTARLKTLK
jgi:hypothetical protein